MCWTTFWLLTSDFWLLWIRNNRLHHRLHLADLLVAEFGFLLQSAQDNFIEAHVNLNFRGGRRDFLAGQFAGEHFVEHYAERINVGPAVHPLRIVLLFRRAVTRRADGLLPGEFVGRAHHSVHAGGSAASRFGGHRTARPAIAAQHFGDAKVRHLHPAGLVEQQVLRLDVAVDDAPVMRELQRVAQRRHDGQRLLRREFPRAQQMAQVHAVHKFHEQVIKSARLAEVVNGDDVRMVQRRQRLRLACEALGKLRIAHPLGREQFQRDEAVQAFLTCLVNHAHAAAAEAFEDFELRKMRGDLFRRQRRLRGGRVVGENGFRLQVQRHEAIGTQPGGRALLDERAALGAF